MQLHKLVKPSAVVMLAWYNTSRKTINKINFKKNNLKLSYSCSSNLRQIYAHNKTILRQIMPPQTLQQQRGKEMS